MSILKSVPNFPQPKSPPAFLPKPLLRAGTKARAKSERAEAKRNPIPNK